MGTESLLRKEGHIFSYLNKANNSVSYDTDFTIKILNKFLKGDISHTDYSDNKHNAKSARCQILLDRNYYKNIGNMLIDTGLVPIAPI